MIDKEILKKMGEETIYSAKGHFKACDLRRNQITITIWVCALLNVLGLIGLHPICDKTFSAVGLFGMIALLIWNEGEGKNYKSRHKKIAEEYLALHKKTRMLFFKSNVTDEEYTSLHNEILAVDNSDKLDIPYAARKLAQRAILKNNETDNWFV